MLVSDDWLRMAGADILLSSSMLRTRLGPDQYEDIPIDVDGNSMKFNLFQPSSHSAVHCLMQHTDSDAANSDLDSDTVSLSDATSDELAAAPCLPSSSVPDLIDLTSDTSSDVDCAEPSSPMASAEDDSDSDKIFTKIYVIQKEFKLYVYISFTPLAY